MAYRDMGTLTRSAMKELRHRKDKEEESLDEGGISVKSRKSESKVSQTSESKIVPSDSEGETEDLHPTDDKPLGKPESGKVEEKKTKESVKSIYCLSCAQTMCFSFIALCCAVFMLRPYTGHARDVSPKEELQVQFYKDMNALVKMLENTESNLKFVNRSITVFMKQGEHKKPAIILLLSTKNSSCSSCRILSRFVNALCNYYEEERPDPGKGYIKADDVGSRNDNEGKLYIENNVENAAKSGRHLVVFEGLDKFPVASLPKVHSYLDHENAPHKGMVYILTGVLDELEGEFEVGKQNQLVKMATDHFDDQWSNYDKEHRRALMGRIVSVIGFIHKTKLHSENEAGDYICKSKCEL